MPKLLHLSATFVLTAAAACGSATNGAATSENGDTTAADNGAQPADTADAAGADPDGVTADSGNAGDAVVTADAVAGPDIDQACPSGKHWMGGNKESPMMKPGQPCVSCHKENFGPALVFAGTVYPNASAENDCNGTPAITVEITGADGTILTQTTNAAGNFFLKGAASKLKMPYTARVFDIDHMRPMLGPQTNGDCNSCHTQTGEKGAPGRIMAP